MYSQAAYTSNEYNYTEILANNLPKLFKTDNNKISGHVLLLFISLYSKCLVRDCRS